MPGKQCPGSYPSPWALAVFLPFSSTKIFESWGELSTKFKNKIYLQYFLSAFLPSSILVIHLWIWVSIRTPTRFPSYFHPRPPFLPSFPCTIKRRLLPLPSPCNHHMSSASSEEPLPLCFLGSYYPTPWWIQELGSLDFFFFLVEFHVAQASPIGSWAWTSLILLPPFSKSWYYRPEPPPLASKSRIIATLLPAPTPGDLWPGL